MELSYKGSLFFALLFISCAVGVRVGVGVVVRLNMNMELLNYILYSIGTNSGLREYVFEYAVALVRVLLSSSSECHDFAGYPSLFWSERVGAISSSWS